MDAEFSTGHTPQCHRFDLFYYAVRYSLFNVAKLLQINNTIGNMKCILTAPSYIEIPDKNYNRFRLWRSSITGIINDCQFQ